MVITMGLIVFGALGSAIMTTGSRVLFRRCLRHLARRCRFRNKTQTRSCPPLLPPSVRARSRTLGEAYI
jgi:hypothetical protein